jgi:hypothetical protein
MAANRAGIFNHPDEFEQYLLDNFHGYLQPLRDLVKEWFHLLILVDKFHAFETKTLTTSFFKSSKSVPPDDISKVVLHDRTANIVGWQFLRKGSTSPYLTSPKSRLGR